MIYELANDEARKQLAAAGITNGQDGRGPRRLGGLADVLSGTRGNDVGKSEEYRSIAHHEIGPTAFGPVLSRRSGDNRVRPWLPVCTYLLTASSI